MDSKNTYGRVSPGIGGGWGKSQEQIQKDAAAQAEQEQQNFGRYLRAKPVAQENPYAAQLMSSAGAGSGAGSASAVQSTANQALNQMLTDPTKLQAMPGYQFQMEQGVQALNRSLAGRGHLNSGNRDIELTKYGQGLAAQQYQSMAQMLSGIGQNASGQASNTFNNQLSAARYGYDTQAADQSRLTAQFDDEINRAQQADISGEKGLVEQVYRKYGLRSAEDPGWGA